MELNGVDQSYCTKRLVLNFIPSNSIWVTLIKGLTQKPKTSREAVDQMLLTTGAQNQKQQAIISLRRMADKGSLGINIFLFFFEESGTLDRIRTTE